MRSFSSFCDTTNHTQSDKLLEYVVNTANDALAANFSFYKDVELVEADKTYTMSLYLDDITDQAIGVVVNNNVLEHVNYWSFFNDSPNKPDKTFTFTAEKFHVLTKHINEMFDCLAAADMSLAENITVGDGMLLTEQNVSSMFDDINFTDVVNNARTTASTAKPVVAATPAAEKAAETVQSAKSFNKIISFAQVSPAKKVYANPDTIFQDLAMSVTELAEGLKHAVLVTGPGGTGKSHTVKKALNDAGLIENKDWFVIKGKANASVVYQTLFQYHDKIIVYDDCDTVLTSKICANILKAALDTEEHRIIAWDAKSMLDTKGKADKLSTTFLNNLSRLDTTHRLPSQFEYSGAIIFLSNLSLEDGKIDKALLTRCDIVDVTLRNEDVGKIIRRELANIKVFTAPRPGRPSVNIGTDLELKTEVLDFMLSQDYLDHLAAQKMALNFRLFERIYTLAYSERKNFDPNGTDWQRRAKQIKHT